MQIHSSLQGLAITMLLRPRGQALRFIILLEIGVIGGWLLVSRLAAPIWLAAVLTLTLLLFPALQKWQADAAELGRPLTVLSILLATQLFHTLEHLAQWVQYHVLHWPLATSSGLISPLNAEIVHFTWNWGVLLTVIYLLKAGLRTWPMWLLLLWATAHTAEHTFMFANYLASGGAQGLPGFFGRGGWLALNGSQVVPLSLLCRLVPALVEAPRLDIHFWWNSSEIILLLVGANSVARQHRAATTSSVVRQQRAMR
jgi:hypothetical protein